jgi:DNA segregation ATPase FtsK/SpoIIIE, S-DNA-T family
MAVLAAAAFSTATATAHADVMAAGTWDGKITGGTLKLGDGDLQNVAVPAGDTFTFTIPAGSAGPVAFTAPATHIAVPLTTALDGTDLYATAGSVDVSKLSGTVDPATGAVSVTAAAHGILHLDFAPTTGPSTSFYCHMGNAPAPSSSPAAPAPFDLGLTGTWSGGSATLADTTVPIVLDCGVFSLGTDPVMVIGTPTLPGSALTLTASFTRQADPAPPANNNGGGTKPTTTTTKPKPTKTFTPAPVRCVVPKLKGLKLKKARKAAKQANCAVGTVKRKKSAKKRTTVLKQGTAAGTVLAEGAKIKLTVAK